MQFPIPTIFYSYLETFGVLLVICALTLYLTFGSPTFELRDNTAKDTFYLPDDYFVGDQNSQLINYFSPNT